MQLTQPPGGCAGSRGSRASVTTEHPGEWVHLHTALKCGCKADIMNTQEARTPVTEGTLALADLTDTPENV